MEGTSAPRTSRVSPIRALLAAAALVAAPTWASAATFTVLNTDDSGPDSLREAMLAANSLGGGDVIEFNIPGTGPHVITLLSPLPILNGPTTIAGDTQPGYAGLHPQIILDGASMGPGHGLQITGPAVAVLFAHALGIRSFDGDGIRFDAFTAGEIHGCYIGTTDDGSAADFITGAGIRHLGDSGLNVGTDLSFPYGMISGCGEAGVVVGNVTAANISRTYIGLARNGVDAAANPGHGIRLLPDAIDVSIGTAGACYISGNDGHGILVEGSTAVQISANHIGLDELGTSAVPNAMDGIHVAPGSTGIVIGNNISDRNFIGGNGGNGVTILSTLLNPSSSITVRNNYIGVGTDVVTDVGNTFAGVEMAGTGGILLNVISGNGTTGIHLTDSNTTIFVEDNIVGLSADTLTAIGNDGDGVFVEGGSKTIRQNIVGDNGGSGIVLSGAGAAGNAVRGNLIGLDITGNARGNAGNGIHLDGDGGANIIGGSFSASEGNVIGSNTGAGIRLSSGAANSMVHGNSIGFDPATTTARPNAVGIMVDGRSSATDIGGTADQRNIVSGNTGSGIRMLNSSNIAVPSGYIGTDATGSTSLGNGNGGILLEVCSDITIGNLTDPAPTVLASGNTGPGIRADNSSNVDVLRVIAGRDALDIAALPNIGAGIRLFASSGILVEESTVASNTLDGIAVVDSLNVDLHSGRIFSNNGHGVSVSATNTSVTGVNIGGLAPGTGNWLAWNVQNGINVSGSIGQTPPSVNIHNNLIGTTEDGLGAQANSDGIHIARGETCRIGSPGAGNVISGNAGGIGIRLSQATGIVIQGNIIGLTSDQSAILPNLQGIHSSPLGADTTTNILIGGDRALGEGNVISGNPASIQLTSFRVSDVDIQGNLIGPRAGDYAVLSSPSFGVHASDGATGIRIGSTKALGNIMGGATQSVVISGSGTDARIRGNYIGVAPDDSATIPSTAGIAFNNATAGIVGGTQDLEGNVISANTTGILINSSENITIQGNRIGTSPDGMSVRGNAFGISLNGGSGIIIAGSRPIGPLDTGNLISGNSSRQLSLGGAGANIQVDGNFIGTDADGTAALSGGPATIGVLIAGSLTGVVIGTPGNGNVISGNTGIGVLVGASGVTVQGNHVGTDRTGAFALSNGGGGILVNNAGHNAVIGGSAPGAGNLVSGNGPPGGIQVGSANDVTIRGNIIGLDATGTAAIPNTTRGINVTNTGRLVIGGAAAGEGNVISGTAGGPGIQFGAVNTDTLIRGNRIGTNAAGTAALGNSGGGIFLAGITAGFFEIGGTGGGGNLISGNSLNGIQLQGTSATPVLVAGNLIGTDATGTADLGNAGRGIFSLLNGVLIGAPGAGRNVVSGNDSGGIHVEAQANIIRNNYVGVDGTGTAALGNTGNGITIFAGAGHIIGTPVADGGNVVSANSSNGISVASAVAFTTIQNNIVGLDAGGVTPLGNTLTGVALAGGSHQVGGDRNLSEGNVIGRNGLAGVDIRGSAAVQGNFIGVNALQQAAPNNTGIYIEGPGTVAIGSGAGLENVISGNNGHGVTIFSSSGTVTLHGNRIGTNLAAAAPLGNGADGIAIATANVVNIGSPDANDRNYIGGNADSGINFLGGGTTSSAIIQGNHIGINATGTAALANGDSGIRTHPGASVATLRIGEAVPGGGNVLSGNAVAGIRLVNLAGVDAWIQGNRIGTNPAGDAAIPNNTGVILSDSTGIIVGTPGTDGGNIISGNTSSGIAGVGTSSTATVQNNIIGLAADGLGALGNGGSGVLYLGDTLTFGGDRALGEGNIVASNAVNGLHLSCNSAVLHGNRIGTNISEVARPNSVSGIHVRGNGSYSIGTSGGRENIISGNAVVISGQGIVIGNGADSPNVAINANRIGTNLLGDTAIPNLTGIHIVSAGAVTIGSTDANDLNLISGNLTHGINIAGPASSISIQGNFIGTDRSGFAAVPNGTGGISMTVPTVISGPLSIGGSGPGAGNLISGNTSNGISLSAGSAATCLIQGNRIGTVANTSAALPNTTNGVFVNVLGTIIGGTSPSARNIISGNGSNGIQITGNAAQVLGNHIGTNAAGAIAIPNGLNGVAISSTNTDTIIGNGLASGRNVISGNTLAGIAISVGARHVVRGNYIGVGASGLSPLGNGGAGVSIANSSFNFIGGSAPGQGNVIAANGNIGLSVGAGSNNNIVRGNIIGLNASQDISLGNAQHGLFARGTGNIIGGLKTEDGNIIAGNGTASADDYAGIYLGNGVNNTLIGNNIIGRNAAGTVVAGNGNIEIAGEWTAGVNNRITANRIETGLLSSIDPAITLSSAIDPLDADTGPNNLLNHPVIVDGYAGENELTIRYHGAPNATFAIELYRSISATLDGHGMAQNFLGSQFLNTDASGNGEITWSIGGLVLDDFYAATATDATGNTSKISRFYQIQETEPTVVDAIALDVSPTLAPDVSWSVEFDRPLRPVDVADFATVETGTVTGTAVTTVDDRFTNAARLDGQSQHYVVQPGTYFTGSFTIETWVYLEAYAWSGRILDFGNGTAADNVVLRISRNHYGRPSFELFNGNTSIGLAESPDVIPLRAWTHLAATYDGTEMVLFVNGEFAAADIVSAPLVSPVRTNNFIGESNWASDDLLHAQMDEVRLWNTARSMAQIQSTMDDPLTLPQADLAAYWNFDQYTDQATGVAGVNDLEDLSGNGLHLDGAGTTPAILAKTNMPETIHVIHADTGAGSGTLDLSVLGRRTMTERAGVTFRTPVVTAQPYTIDRNGPVLVGSIVLLDPNPTSLDVVRFQVIFSEDVVSFDPTDITVDGTVSGLVGLSGSNPTYIVSVTVDDPAEDGLLGITIGTDVFDLLGNPFAGATSNLYSIQNNLPPQSATGWDLYE